MVPVGATVVVVALRIGRPPLILTPSAPIGPPAVRQVGGRLGQQARANCERFSFECPLTTPHQANQYVEIDLVSEVVANEPLPEDV